MKSIILAISTLSALICALPCLVSMEIDGEGDLREVVESSMWHDTLVIATAPAIPVILDALLDYFLPHSMMLARWQMIGALFLPNFVMFLSCTLHWSNQLEIFVACIHIREILLLGALLFYCICSNCENFVCVLVNTILCSTGVSISAFSLYFPDIYALKLAYSVLIWVSYIGIICVVVRVLIHYRGNDTYKIVYVSCLLAKLLCKGIVSLIFINTSWASQKVSFYILLTTLNAIIIVVASALPGRIARVETQKNQISLETKRNFVRYISHEIRTPLNTVYMGIQLVAGQLMQVAGTDELLELIGDIEDSCSVSIEILNDLLLFDKLECGAMKLDCRPFHWVTLLSAVIKPFEVQARQCQVDLRYLGDECISPEAELALVCADSNKISQVIRNLVSNAIKFTPPNGRVTIKNYLQSRIEAKNDNKIHCEKKIVRFEVSDTGPGISEENQKRLFKEIVQFNAADLQNGKGSGLGLWISKGIMDLHGGHIGVYSSGVHGEGCTFFIELDVVPLRNSLNNTAAASEFEVDCASRVKQMQPRQSPSARCLVVDDSSFNRKMMRRVLETYYGEVAEAGDGMEAVQMVEDAMHRGANYDAIFMDSVMPRMGGIEATAMLRRIAYSGLIVGVTGNALPEDIAEFMSSGANRVLTKPLQLQHVTDVIHELNSPDSVCLEQALEDIV